MPDDLTPEEKELLAAHRKERADQKKTEDAGRRVWLRNPDGDEVDLDYATARPYLQKKWGLDLDEEPVQDPAAEGADPAPATPGGEVRRFGRRMA